MAATVVRGCVPWEKASGEEYSNDAASRDALCHSSCSQSGRAGSAGWPGSWLVEGMPRLKALDAGDVTRCRKQMLLSLHSSSRPIVYPCE